MHKSKGTNFLVLKQTRKRMIKSTQVVNIYLKSPLKRNLQKHIPASKERNEKNKGRK
jgi:hypothetical protein